MRQNITRHLLYIPVRAFCCLLIRAAFSDLGQGARARRQRLSGHDKPYVKAIVSWVQSRATKPTPPADKRRA